MFRTKCPVVDFSKSFSFWKGFEYDRFYCHLSTFAANSTKPYDCPLECLHLKRTHVNVLQPTWPKSVRELKKPKIAFDAIKLIPSLESCELFMTTSSATLTTLTTALTTTTLTTTTAKMPEFRWRGQLELVRDQNGFGCARTSRHLRSSG